MEFSCKIYKYKRANLNLKRKLALANLAISQYAGAFFVIKLI